MVSDAVGLSTYSFALAASTYAAFAAYLIREGYARRVAGRTQRVFVAAVGASAAWALLALLEPFSRLVSLAFASSALDLLRYGLWLAFLLMLASPGTAAAPRADDSGSMLRLGRLLLAVAALLFVYRVATGRYEEDASRLSLACVLVLAVFGLVVVEQLFRNLGEDSRWSAKPVCLGLACIFAYDVYLYAEAILLGHFDADARSIRGAVHMLAVPLLYLAASRRQDWIKSLQVSRTAAFYSAALVLAGGYLLFMAAIGYYVRFFGGDWGRALQLGLLFAALVALAALTLSGSLRARVRVFVGKHFFSYRYDYREEWLRFTAMLSSHSSPQDVGDLVIRGLANMIECSAGSLWYRDAASAGSNFRMVARWNQPHIAEQEAPDSPFCGFLREKGWVIDVAEYRSTPRRYGQLPLPAWLLDNPHLWLVVPLIVSGELTGFVTLALPRTPVELDWEVRDLLKTASRQAAGYLAQMHATEALLEARKFDAFNRMSAFVVHDLKNIVAQLSLMLKNAERLHDNREFQQDMLLTVESSLEKMRRLMLQLREGATPPGGTRGVELGPIVGRLQAMVASGNRTLDVQRVDKLATRGHEDRLERVFGHIVQNALDATPPEGRVWLCVERHSGQVKVEIGDTGSGMSEEFVQSKLFRPFHTTKHNGMGIGSYESAQYIRELGGSIAVDSQPGHGTVITLLMPLFESQTRSDLHTAGAA